MRILVFLILLIPIASNAQKLLPRFENDTLYTACGYTIYKGQTLNFAKGSSKDGSFRFIRFIGASNEKLILSDNSVFVNKLSHYNITGLGNAYIVVHGNITFKDGTKGKIKFNMAFDRAIESFPGLASELVVPEEFRNSPKGSLSAQINDLYQLYKDSAITKQEFERQKKELLKKH